jgi:hypothetical protein
MPITLNHSNISVQYSSDKSYIIETVKSDLYLKNDNYDNIIRNNLQTAPVTPIVYIENTSNVYAIESYTYTGSANTADYTRVFPKNTVCDILVVGGGGAGGTRIAGGGGAGALIYVTNQTITTGTYTIKVGRGGIGTINSVASMPPYTGETGKDSEIFNNSGAVIYRAKGGGGGDINAFTASQSTPYVQGGSSGGVGPNFNNGGNNYISSGVSPVSTNVLTINGNTTTISPNNVSVYGNSGGGGCIFSGKYMSGGGGGAGSIGQTINTNVSKSGNGGSAISISITGSPVSYAGGGGAGGGRLSSTLFEPGTGGSINGIQVGGNGGYLKASTTFNSITYPAEGVGGDGLANTGSGGGGSGTDDISQASTSAYKGGSGGSGIVIIRYLLGTVPSTNLLTAEPTVTPYVFITDGYYPRIPSTNSATWTDNGYTVNVKVSDPVLTTWFVYFLFNHIITSDDHYHSTQVYLNNGSTTYSGATSFKGNSGIAISIDIGRNIYPKRIRIAPRVLQLTSPPGTFKIYASNNPSSWNDNNHIDWVLIHSQTSAATFISSQYTIISLSNTPSISYRYYTMVVMTLAGNYGYLAFSEWSIGGDEKFDAIPEGNSITHKRLNFVYNSDNLVAWYKFNGDYLDSSGNGHNLTNVGTVIQSTHIIEGQTVEFDSTDYLEFPATINPYTIWNGKGITFSFWIRITSITGTYSRFIDFQSAASSTSGILFAFTGTQTFYLNCNGTTLDYYNNSITTNLGVWHHILWCIDNTGKWDVYLNNLRINNTQTSTVPNITYNLRYINKSTYTGNGVWGGQMDDFRIYDRALSAADVSLLYNKTYSPNAYTLNFPVPTLADINNNSNIVLRGAYDIALSISNALIIPKAGQYIPKPTSFANYNIERMYPPVRNFTAATTTVSGQTYGNGTYVVSYSSFVTPYEPFKCFNTSDTVGGHWAEGYTSGNYNGSAFIVAGYLGDWLKIQLPVAIKLTRFGFLMRTDTQDTRDRSPKDFKIYGSNDNITWVELVNKTGAVYNASYIYEQTTPEITNTYTYYGLVVNKTFITVATVLNFDEWYIYGQEVLPSSLSIRYHLLNPTPDPIGAQWTYSSNNTNVYHMGSVGIGTTSPEYQLDVRGAIYSSIGGITQTGLTTWSITSDRRIKENITRASYDICLENVKNIELYNFNFKNNCVNTNDKHQLGFIAQEVQQVYPKAVEVGKMILNTNEKIDNLLTLNTTQIDYTLYGAVKNLIEKIEDIENDLENIEK